MPFHNPFKEVPLSCSPVCSALKQRYVTGGHVAMLSNLLDFKFVQILSKQSMAGVKEKDIQMFPRI